MISVCFQGKPFNVTVIQVYAPTSNAEEAAPTPKKICPSHHRGLECKSRKSRDTCSNSQVTVKFGVQNEAEQRLTVLPREHTGHSKHPLRTT